jgi:peptidoglycan hydrolase-like protein with peptidoglycan-binding domain
MLAEFTRENLQRGAHLGGPDANANVYAFHNLGQRDAARFLEGLAQSPDLRVDAVLPAAVVRGNPGLYGDGSQSISQAYAAMGVQMARFDRYALGIDAPGNSKNVDQGAPREVGERRLAIGDNGPDVMRVQTQLNALGYKDANGHRLQNDGDFGHRTEEAVKSFQVAHGLPPVGHVGPRTHAALEAARLHGATPVDPAHPDHALQRQVSRAVDAMERFLGRTPDENSERLKASLLLTERQNDLTRVDHVVLSEARGPVQAGQHVFAVQGRLDDPASRRVHVATQQALATPVQASWARLAQVEAMERMQSRNTYAYALAARHGEHGDGMRRMPAP